MRLPTKDEVWEFSAALMKEPPGVIKRYRYESRQLGNAMAMSVVIGFLGAISLAVGLVKDSMVSILLGVAALVYYWWGVAIMIKDIGGVPESSIDFEWLALRRAKKNYAKLLRGQSPN